MGIDLRSGGRRVRRKARTRPASDNVYLKLLTKIFAYIKRRSASKSRFASVVLKRLYQSKTNRAPLSISRLSRYMNGKDGKTAVVVGTVTDDTRSGGAGAAQGLSVCALRFTESARARITAGGGECLTFDQLALRAPTGTNTVLLRGPRDSREAVKHFGHRSTLDSVHTHDHVKPYVRNKGRSRKQEMARGRRRSNGFRV